MKPYNYVDKTRFGIDCLISYGRNFKIGKGSTYNDRCQFNARYGIEIGENTLIGPSVLIWSVNHVIKNIDVEQNACDENSWCKGDLNKRVMGKKVIIGNDVWIGAGVIILAGAIIPDKCVIGAGTLITESISKRLIKTGDVVVSNAGIKIIGNRKDKE